MLSFTPKQLTDAEFEKHQSVYENEVSGDAAKQDDVWEELHAFFRDKNATEDKQWYQSFFRWYTDLTWKRIRDLTFGEATEIAFRRQIPMALLLGFDVLDEFLWYADWNTLASDDIQLLFKDARTAYDESQAYFGTYKEKEYTQKDVLEEIVRLEGVSADTYQVAEWYGQMEEMLKSIVGDEAIKRFPANPLNDVVKRFVELHAFFVEIEIDEIADIVFAYVRQDWFAGEERPSVAQEGEEEENRIDQIRVGAEAVRDIAKGKTETPAQQVTNVPKEQGTAFTEPQPAGAPRATTKKPSAQPDESTAPASKEPEQPPPPPPPKKRTPSYNTIRKQIESEFSFGADGQPEDVEGVIARLDALAEEYADEKITELLYFNENSGTFEWNDALFSSNPS